MKPITIGPSLLARVAAEIRTAILDGTLSPGSRVKQEELAARLGVSREPVRQALLLLQREGLVHAEPNRSAIVAPVDPQLITDVYEFREAVEGLIAARLAARRDFDPAPLREIVARGRAAVREGNVAHLIDLDMAFHSGLYEAAGNRVVIDVMKAQWSHIRRVMAMVLRSATYRQHVWDEHAAILEAIAAGRVGQARTRAVGHIRAARDMLLANFRPVVREGAGTR